MSTSATGTYLPTPSDLQKKRCSQTVKKRKYDYFLRGDQRLTRLTKEQG